MADIRFYTLNTAGAAARFRHACKLIEQAYLGGERVLIWLEGAAAMTQMDQLLWTFGDRAFVPHEALAADPRGCEAPVQLHEGPALPEPALAGGFTTLVNLRDAPAGEALRFDHVIEVLDGDAACREAGRRRFRFYRESGGAPRHIAVTEDD